MRRWLAAILLLLIPVSCEQGDPLGTAIEAESHGGPIVVAEPADDRQALLEAHAETLEAFDDLDYGSVGSVLEGLVRAELTGRFDSERFEITGGIQYANRRGRTLGELDLVVIHRQSGDVVLVGEVKLSGNLRAAGREARSQLDRFRRHVAAGTAVRFWKGRREFQPRQFDNVTRYWLCGPLGAVEAGWDMEVDLTRAEGDELQAMVGGAARRH